jgi:hypothetical protein
MANQTVRNIRLIEDYRDKILFYRLYIFTYHDVLAYNTFVLTCFVIVLT